MILALHLQAHNELEAVFCCVCFHCELYKQYRAVCTPDRLSAAEYVYAGSQIDGPIITVCGTSIRGLFGVHWWLEGLNCWGAKQ